MIFSDIVSFAFRLINFFVLIYFFYYMFKTQGRASLEEEVAQQEVYDTGLQEQHHMLQARLQESKQEKLVQEQECIALQHKIERWQEQHDVENAKQQKAVLVLHHQLMERTAKQKEELYQSMLTQQALRQALPQIQAVLEKQYATGSEGKNFIDNALKTIQRVNQ